MNQQAAAPFRTSPSRNAFFAAAVLGLASLAVHPTPTIVQAAQQPSDKTPPAAAANSSKSELQDAVSEFSRSEREVPTGPVPRLANGHPDLSGYWTPSRKDRPVGNIGKDLPGYKLPLTPAGLAALQYNREHTVDPESLCILGGIPRHDASALPFQLLEGTDYVSFLYWYTTYRLIPTDGRNHSDDPDPSFFGEEVATWNGDSLVIDAIGFKDKRTWADENADPHSDQLHVIETWTRPDLGHLHLELAMIDPKFYTEPVHYQRTWLLGAPGVHVQEYACSEENVDAPHLQPGPGPIGPDGQRGYEKLAPLPPPPDKDHPAKTSIPE